VDWEGREKRKAVPLMEGERCGGAAMGISLELGENTLRGLSASSEINGLGSTSHREIKRFGEIFKQKGDQLTRQLQSLGKGGGGLFFSHLEGNSQSARGGGHVDGCGAFG